jgi:hypothetical protein
MIAQKIHTSMNLQGDGTSTTFTFDLGHVYGLNFQGTPGVIVSTSPNPLLLIDPIAIPDAVAVDYTIPSQGVVSASISRRTITVTFAIAPTAEFTLGLALIFNG